MSDFDEPELYVVTFPDDAGDTWRAETERLRRQARERYIEHLGAALTDLDPVRSLSEQASAVLDAVTDWNDVETGEPCRCCCHPRLPAGELHDFGFACPCRKTAAERERSWDEWFAETDAFWSSPEGERITAGREAEERELRDWLARHPEVEVRSHGGWAPEQWRGAVDGRSFYFRERHDHWRIELDLRPSGRLATVWVDGDLDDESSFERREIDVGDVIGEGTTAVAGYGESPLARLRFIVREIRAHVLRQTCTLHTTGRAAAETALGCTMAWCPACGSELDRARA